MGRIDDAYSGGSRGHMIFDFDFLSALHPQASYVNFRPAAGDEIHFGDEIADINVGAASLLTGVYIHWNNSARRDDKTAVCKIPLEKLNMLSEARKLALEEFARVPPGFNRDNPGRFPGVSKPVPINKQGGPE